MARKNLTEARTDEILDAFARCMVKYGLDASLEQVAEEAGMTRSIIRHYIGNREEVVNRLIERISQEYLQELREAEAHIPQGEMIAVTLDYLFGDEPGYDDYDKLIIDVMMTAKERYPQAKQSLMAMLDELVAMFTKDLRLAYPQASEIRCQEVAYSILCLAMSNESFLWMGMNPAYNTAARSSAEALLKSLEESA
ncbi:MAG: TetR/AcrR family transcriptional regulator [Anaerolineae bacterium]|nr:TetR/AcrR family transcriptional regulator [Anaerolineae bacterium]